MNPARKSNVRRGDEHGIVAGHTDDEHREPRPCDVLPVVVHRAPETGGPLPEAEVGDLHLLVHERVPPGTGRGSIRGIREGLAELIPLELGPDKGRGEPAHRRSRGGAKSSGHASLEPAPPRRVLRILVARLVACTKLVGPHEPKPSATTRPANHVAMVTIGFSGVDRKSPVDAAASVVGGVDNLTGVLKVTGFVASVPEFTGQPGVINGASELLGDVFGDAGRHAGDLPFYGAG